MIDEAAVTLTGSSKTYMNKDGIYLLHQKKQDFSFLFIIYCCCFQTYLYSFLQVIFSSIFGWYHFRNTPLEPSSLQRSFAVILKGEKITYLCFLFSADTQTQQIITSLPSVFPELGIIGLLLLDTIIVIIFISKGLEGIQFSATEERHIQTQMHASCW